MGAYSVREKQGLVPGLQLDDPHYELKGIRVEHSARALITVAHGVRSTGFSTGVAKKELSIANLMVEKTAELDRGTFGVAVGQGPWQRRLEEIGGIKPLAAGLWLVWGDGARPRSASLLAWRNEGRMRWRIGVSLKTARWQSGYRCSTCGGAGGGLRCGGRKRRSSLVG
jgi:hypothetical protein